MGLTMSFLKRAGNLLKGAVAVSQKKYSPNEDRLQAEIEVEKELRSRHKNPPKSSRKQRKPPPVEPADGSPNNADRETDLPPKKRTL